MRQIIQSAILLVVLAVSCTAGLIVDFTTLPQPVNITAPDHPAYSVEATVTTFHPYTLIPSFARFGYDPENIALTRCGFDTGLGGTQFDFNCVGAQVDTSGIRGTTEGVYTLDIDTPITNLDLRYDLFSMLPNLHRADFMLIASLSLNGAPLPDDPDTPLAQTFTLTGRSNFLRFSGESFDHAELRFFPIDPLTDPGGVLPDQVGQTGVQIYSVGAVPEPGTIFLSRRRGLLHRRQQGTSSL